MSKELKILLYLIAVFVLWVLSKILEIRLAYKPVFDWWQQNGGNKYKFSLLNLYASYNSYILYGLTRLVQSPQYSLSLPQMTFFIDYILKYTYYVDSDKQPHGVIMPPHVAESALLKYGQGITDFDEWYSNPRNPRNDTPWDPSTNPAGVYPTKDDITNWKVKMAMWAGYDQNNSNSFWVSQANGIISPNTDTVSTWAKAWNDTYNNPDNFLARSGVMPDSPLVIAFINNKYSDPNNGVVFDAEAFKNLVGFGNINYGGWLGFLKGMEAADISEDKYANILYTQYTTIPPPPPADCGGGGAGWFGSITSALTAGLSLAIMGPEGIAAGIAVAGMSIGSKVATYNKCKAAGGAN